MYKGRQDSRRCFSEANPVYACTKYCATETALCTISAEGVEHSRHSAAEFVTTRAAQRGFATWMVMKGVIAK